MRPGQRVTRRIERSPKLVIAAVTGLTFGGECELTEAARARKGIASFVEKRSSRFIGP
jgi:enoyl-CoA hydratase/carnithine racemase